MLQSLLEIGLVMASSYISTADQWPAVIKLLITASLKSAAAAPDVDSPSAGPVHAGTRHESRVVRNGWKQTVTSEIRLSSALIGCYYVNVKLFVNKDISVGATAQVNKGVGRPSKSSLLHFLLPHKSIAIK